VRVSHRVLEKLLVQRVEWSRASVKASWEQGRVSQMPMESHSLP
jgi:hypothetical protein